MHAQQSLLALQLNSKGARYGKTLRKSLQDIAIAIRGDIWLISGDELAELGTNPHDLAEDGTPSRMLERSDKVLVLVR